MSSTYVDGTTPLDAAHMNALQQKVEKGQANGYASLDATTKVPLAQLPAITPAYVGVPSVSYGTTPPASPNDGDIWFLPVDTTFGFVWQFRYRAASASPYKWEFVGGQSLLIQTGPGVVLAAGGWNAVAGAAAWTVLRAGDYQTEAWAEMANGGTAQICYADAGTASGGSYRMGVNAAANVTVSPGGRELITLAASAVVKVFVLVTGGASCTINLTSLKVSPIRVS